MLGKLIKYEFRATGPMFLMVYVAIIALAVFSRILALVQLSNPLINFLFNMGMFAYVVAVCGVMILTIVIIVLRFYKNLMGDEGYLMFTLPVSVEGHIWSKFIVSFLWLVASGFVVFISIFILNIGNGILSFFSNFFSGYFYEFGRRPILMFLFTVVFLLFLIFSIASTIYQFYAAISAGPSFTKNRLLGSVLAFIGISVIINIIQGVILIPFSISGFYYFDFFFSTEAEGLLIFLSVLLLIQVIKTVGCYFITRYFLKNKLNLG